MGGMEPIGVRDVLQIEGMDRDWLNMRNDSEVFLKRFDVGVLEW